MLLKRGVKLENVSPPLMFALGVAEVIWRQVSPVELVVTSLDDSQHGAASLHFSKNSPDKMCRAVDLRTRGLNVTQIEACWHGLRNVLYAHGFDVVKEANHLHLEYDPKGARSFDVLTVD